MEIKTMFLILILSMAWRMSCTEGTKWAFLIAGSRGFGNYRHQADVCHAYQILREGGLNDENIIVMMYDDIATNLENRSFGYIYNRPDGPDVYAGVPKDYTGYDVNVQNIFSVIKGDGTYLSGGSGKVLKTGPEDTVLIYISSHGNYRTIDIVGTLLWATDFVKVLVDKRDSYKKMVIFVESCLSGSMFDTYLTSTNIGIYATTASNGEENSHAYYCPGSANNNIGVCLGDLYSISWMEDSELYDRSMRTLQQQYFAVYNRTDSSHVMQYGDMNMQQDFLDTYMGATPPVDNNSPQFNTPSISVTQDEAHLLYLKHKVKSARNGTEDQLKAQKALEAEIAHRKRDDRNVILMWKHLFGKETSSSIMLASVRQPAVDETNCLKMLAQTYDHYCGPFSTYGLRYLTSFGHICGGGFSNKQMIEAISHTCPLKNLYWY